MVSATPSMDTDYTSDSEAEEPGDSPQLAASPFGGNGNAGITFISPFASQKGQTTFLPPTSPMRSTTTAHSPARASAPLASKEPDSSFLRRGSHITPSLRDEIDSANAERRRNSVDAAVLAEFSGGSTISQRRASKRLRSDSKSSDYTRAEPLRLSKHSPSQSNDSTKSILEMNGGRELAFADHLTAILNHSLSLCSGEGETMLDILVRGEPSSMTSPGPTYSPSDSPRASFSTTATANTIHAGSPASSTSTFGGSPPSSARLAHLPPVPEAMSPAKRKQLTDRLRDWGFNALELDADELWECASIMFESVLAMEGVEAGVNMQQMRGLLLALRSAYHARNGYHNFSHATDVLQATYSFLFALGVVPPLNFAQQHIKDKKKWRREPRVDARGGMGELLRPMDVFALLIAAIGHDVGHPGLSNAYMVNARTPVAQVYGDKSVLENFHTVTLIQMLRKHGLGHLFGAATRPVSANDPDCRKVLFASVLATDMSRHFPFVAKLTELARRLDDHDRRPDEIEEDRLLLCSGLMKCADISNPTRPHEVAKAWSTALLEEWTVQAKIEEEFQLPVSVVVLNPTEAKAQAKSQVGFINLFTQPLFDAMTAFVPEFSKFADSCREGRRIWEAIVLQPDDQASSSSQPTTSPATTPRAAYLSRIADAHAHGETDSKGVRRRAPPRPINVMSKDRNAYESSSASVSPGVASPFSSDGGRFSSFSSMSCVGSPRQVPTSRLQCTGMCGEVTEKCYACLLRERGPDTAEVINQRRESILRLDPANKGFLSLVGQTFEIDEEEALSQEVWPPLPFYPCP